MTHFVYIIKELWPIMKQCRRKWMRYSILRVFFFSRLGEFSWSIDNVLNEQKRSLKTDNYQNFETSRPNYTLTSTA